MERRKEVEGRGKVNELLWTELVVDIHPRRVVRRCRVIKVKRGENVPRLADWAGSSDWFFYREDLQLEEVPSVATDIMKKIEIDSRESTSTSLIIDDPPAVSDSVTVTMQAGQSSQAGTISQSGLEESTPLPSQEDSALLVGRLAPLTVSKSTEETPTPTFKHESEPNMSYPADISPEEIPEERKLRGLDLFCGGGNFGRGVADGGAVHHKWFHSSTILLTVGLLTST